MNERAIFEAASEIPDPEQRRACLDRLCGGNVVLRARIEALLESHESPSQFLNVPAVGQFKSTAVPTGQPTATQPNPGDAGHGLRPDDDSDGEQTVQSDLSFLSPSSKPDSIGKLGHYEILQVLGQGAFGIVFKAFDEKLHRLVAIKVLNPQMAATSPPRKRFLREARSAAAIRHENIVQVYSVEEQPLPYLAMEFVDGQTLQQKLDGSGPLDVPEILHLGRQMAAGLAAAHDKGLIHRDIKPGNILLETDTEQKVKITDFGLARAADDATMTRTGTIAGTPMYMAPEQALGLTLDQRADLFSLGSVLYQMTCGRPPFRGANALAVLKRVIDETPRPIQDILPQVPDWLCAIIEKLHAKNPDDRYQTAQEVADLLARCQRELEHNGQVTCVARHSGTNEARGFQAKRPTGTGTKKRPLGWLVVGLLAVATAIGFVLMNGGQEMPVHEATSTADNANSPTTTKTPRNPTEATTWHGWPADAPPPATAPFDANQAKQHQQAWATYLDIPVEYENSIGMKFRLIPPGEFTMGSTPAEIEESLKIAGANTLWGDIIKTAAPQHQVILTNPIYLGVNEVTQAEYEQVMGINPAHFAATGSGRDAVAGQKTADYPVEQVNWNDAAEFCAKLSEQEDFQPFYSRIRETVTILDGTGYRLPTEAEWEFACRAGTTGKYWIGEDDQVLSHAAWFSLNSGFRSHSVGELHGNPFGLYDIHGNVWEWLQDSWDPAYYAQFDGKPAVDPNHQSIAGAMRGVRGGRWNDQASGCRASHRNALLPTHSYSDIGFRVALPIAAVRQTTREAVERIWNVVPGCGIQADPAFLEADLRTPPQANATAVELD